MPSNHHTDDVFVQKRRPKNPIKFNVQLNDEQKQAKALILESPVTVIRGMAGSGKAQPLTSTVYTPTGPVEMGSLKVGDEVLGKQGVTEVLGIYPQGEEDVYKITCSDGSTTKASLEHLWTVKPKTYATNQGNWKVRTTEELIEDLKKGIEYKLPRIDTAHFQTKEVPMDPYLLGVLLAEGHLREDVVTFSTSDSKVLSNIQLVLEGTDTKVRHIANYDYRFKKRQKDNKPNEVVISCRELGLTGKTSYNKFIPNQYKYNSEEIRIKILQGLIDGDGYVNKKGQLIYNTSSKMLSRDVSEVFRSLGARVTERSFFPTYTYLQQKKVSTHLHYELSITIEDSSRFATIPYKVERLKNRTNRVKYLNRVIKKIEKVSKEQTQCIKVAASDSLYLTDNFIVTHNTLVATQVALDMLFTKQVEKIIITRPTVSKEEIGFLPGDLQAKMDPWLAPIYHNLYMLYNEEKIKKELEAGNIEIVPFAFMRGRTFTDSFIIVDEAQNVTHNQMETVIGRLGRGSKMAICGDMAQIDLKDKRETGFSFLSRLEEQVKGFRTINLLQNHRHDIVSPILKVYSTFRD